MPAVGVQDIFSRDREEEEKENQKKYCNRVKLAKPKSEKKKPGFLRCAIEFQWGISLLWLSDCEGLQASRCWGPSQASVHLFRVFVFFNGNTLLQDSVHEVMVHT